MKIKIKNKDNKTIVALLEKSKDDKDLAFIAHGLGGFKEQPHIKAFNDVFRECGCTTVRWDARDSIGESEGKMENATLTSYLQDLEDVIKWAKKQSWFKKPFILCAHSLASAAILLYAQKHPKEIESLAPISAVLPGKYRFECYAKKELEEWKKKGYFLKKSRSKPGVIKKISWKLMEDILKHDLFKDIHKLTMPVLLIVGDQDESTPVNQQKILLNSIPGDKKRLYFIKNAPHTFRNEKRIKQIKEIMKKWLLATKPIVLNGDLGRD